MNKRWVHLCIIVILALVYFRGVYLRPGEMVYSPNSDLIRYHAPQYSFLMEAFRRDGEIPLWLPWRWCGTPLLADSQSSVFYPFTWILSPIPPDYRHGYYFIIHAVMGGIFMYLYLTEIGLSRPAGLGGGIFYMFGGLGFCMYFYHHVGYLFSWTPLLLYFAEKIVRRPTVYLAALLGLVAAAQFLGCHAQYFTFNMCMLSCYLAWIVFWRLREDAGAALRVGGYLILSCGIFLSLIAVQLLPSMELSQYFSRRGGFSFYDSSYSTFYPWDLWRCVFTAPGTVYFPIYFGFCVSLLSFWGMVLNTRRVKIFFMLFSLMCLIYALGKFSPLFYLCYKLLSPFRYFRDPRRSLWIFSFSWIALAALGLDSLLRGGGAAYFREASYRRSMRLAAVTAVASLPIFFLITLPGKGLAMVAARRAYALGHFRLPFEAHRGEIEELLSRGSWMSLQLLLFIAVSYLLLCVVLRRSPLFLKRVVFPLLVIGATAELFLAGRDLHTIRPEILYEETEPLRFLKSQAGTFRVLGMGSPRPLPQFLARHYGIELADGYSPSVLADYLRFTGLEAPVDEIKGITKLPLTEATIDDLGPDNVLDLLNVRFVLSLQPAADDRFELRRTFHRVPVYRQLKGIVPERDYYVYENTSAMPRAFIVPEARVIPDREELLRRIATFDPRRVVLLERHAGDAPGDEPFRAVAYESCSPNRIDLDVELRHPAYLVLSEIWYPGWKAYDNGREKEVLRVDYLLRGMHLDPGAHSIVFRFEPESYTAGRAISIFGVVACVAVIAIGWSVDRRLRRVAGER